MWLAFSYLAEGNRDMAIGARDEYHELRHSDESITEKCGLCEYVGINYKNTLAVGSNALV